MIRQYSFDQLAWAADMTGEYEAVMTDYASEALQRLELNSRQTAFDQLI